MYNQAAYMLVYNSLKDRILSGAYPIGSLLPPEPALETMYKVSRTTVRKATDMLVQEGYVNPQRGVGTVVLDYHVTQNLNRITSMTETLQAKGYRVSLKEFYIQVIEASESVANMLDVPLHSKVAKIKRVSCANQIPVAIIYNYIPYELVPGIETYADQFISLYKFLEEQYYINIEMAQDNIGAMNATAEIAQKLNVPENFAILSINRKCVSKGRCISYDMIKARHDMYSFAISLYGR
ncbi:MAG: GntR family transcriptional regulator [Clostridia bacterium]|nr:GntR family transcriptional regulator [Clostridia bacterium]